MATNTLQQKVQAISMVLLMIASTLALAANPNGRQMKTFVDLANAAVPSNYEKLSDLAAKLHAASVAMNHGPRQPTPGRH
jgi:hypothetical protein